MRYFSLSLVPFLPNGMNNTIFPVEDVNISPIDVDIFPIENVNFFSVDEYIFPVEEEFFSVEEHISPVKDVKISPVKEQIHPVEDIKFFSVEDVNKTFAANSLAIFPCLKNIPTSFPPTLSFLDDIAR